MAKKPKPPKASKLKVFRTPIGFHDAYVATHSRKAALKAWGSDKDLFARGAGEEVTDPALTEEPLAHPGEVIRRLRGTAEEQIAALPADRPADDQAARKAAPRKSAAKRPPKPSRAELDEAEQALAEAERRLTETMKAIAARETALARERRAAEQEGSRELGRLKRSKDEREAAFRRAMRAWRG